MTTLETTGEYQVKREDCFYTDASRLETYTDDSSFRELPVSFWYPANYQEPRSCPLVVFSHGSFGVRESNETLYRELASHGYVVCSIDHTYHSFSAKLSNGKTVRVGGSFPYLHHGALIRRLGSAWRRPAAGRYRGGDRFGVPIPL